LTIDNTEFFKVEFCEHCFNHVNIVDLGCCAAPNKIHVRHTFSGGGVHVKNQCTNCGKVESNAIPGYSKEQRDALPALDEVKRDERYEKQSALYKSVHASISERKLEARRKVYSDYLTSPEWKSKRNEVLKRDKYLCQSCLDAFATQVHHKSYRLEDLTGDVPAFDLVAICTPCHENIHKKSSYAKPDVA
jgi:hypothetical protein